MKEWNNEKIKWKEWKRMKEWKKNEKITNIKRRTWDLITFGRKMEGLCIGMQWVTELNYITINVYSHGTLRCLTGKGKIV